MQVLGVNVGPDPLEDLLVFVDAFQVTFPVLLDTENVYSLYRQTGGTSPFPLDYIIDQNGYIAYIRTEYDPEAMTMVIDGLLGNSAGIAVSPASLDFGDVLLGRSQSQLVNVDNTGAGDLQIHSITTGTEDFSVNINAILVPPGATRALLVTFTPAVLGPRQDTLLLLSNDPGQPLVEIPLQGVGGDPTDVAELPRLTLRLGNEPNPFNPRTLIRFDLPRDQIVQMTIYDTQGRAIRHLIRAEPLLAGQHVRHWDGLDDGGKLLSSGIYFILLEAGDEVVNHKMTLLR